VSRCLLFAVGVSLVGCGFGVPLIGDDSGDGDGDGSSDGLETEESDTEDTCGPTEAVVERVIDGDTVELDSGQTIRYILVNTPETTNGKNECGGQAATEYNAGLVLDQAVTLEYDVECKDQYGRLLAYVSVQNNEVNRLLLEKGHACLLHVPPNGNSKVAEYQGLEDAAKSAEVGMWGSCGSVACDW